MSNKPRIYANCPAGCRWETVHKSDFDKSAAYIKQYADSDGCFHLDIGKTYKINTIINPTELLGTWAFAIYATITYSFGGTEYSSKEKLTLPDFNKYEQNITFCFHEATNEVMGVPQTFINLAYHVNGEGSTDVKVIEGSNISNLTVALTVEPSVAASIECLVINEHAEIRAKSAYDYAREGGYTGTEEEFAAMLGAVVAVRMAEEESF
jgi:hypothetical protein